jgi:hypothetical protein
MKKPVMEKPRHDEKRSVSGTNVARERRRELRRLDSGQLLALLQLAKHELSIGELYYIHDLAARRLDKGDQEADAILLEVRPLV